MLIFTDNTKTLLFIILSLNAYLSVGSFQKCLFESIFVQIFKVTIKLDIIE